MSLTTPDDILEFWLGDAAHTADALKEKSKLWFRKSDDTDRRLRERFGETVEALADGLADDWAQAGRLPRLAAIIALDQFSRNIYRGTPASFANDPLALKLTLSAIEQGDHVGAAVVEQVFLFLPLEHAEDLDLQVQCVELFRNLKMHAPEAFSEACADWLDYAHRHKKVIDLFGRFPHRNAILGRPSTPAELEFLAQPGSGF